MAPSDSTTFACLSEQQIVSFLERHATRQERAAVDVHIDECAGCRALLAALARALPSNSDEATAATVVTTEAFHRGAAQNGQLERGTLVGRFVLVDILGAGGMGTVYAAYDPELDRKAAVKLLHTAPGDNDDRRDLLLREARAMAQLSHDNVVGVYEVGTFRQQIFLAMELVQGATIRSWQRESERGWQAIVERYAAAGAGLAAAHNAGIVHGDFKPENVLVTGDGRVKVGDFGLASRIPLRTNGAPTQADSPPSTIRGTPAYMAPEQLAGQAPDARSDQFSFCVALFEALHGQRPFSGTTVAERRAPPAEELARLDTERKLPTWLRRCLLRGLAESPHDRHGSMDALAAELTRPRARVRLWAAAGLLACAAVIAAFLLGSFATERTAVCAGGEQHWNGVWDHERQQQLQDAFAASGAPYADAAWELASTTLDRYRQHWLDARRTACEETHVQHTQSSELLDRRMQCLARRLPRAEAVVATLGRGDREAVERTAEILATLGAIDDCADTGTLLQAQPLPEDPARRNAIEQGFRAIGEVDALVAAGALQPAKQRAAALATGAEPLDYPALTAQAWQSWARAESAAGAPNRGAELLEKALLAAEQAGDDLLRARVLVDAVQIVGHELMRYDEGVSHSRHARAILDRLPGQEALEAHRLLRHAQLRIDQDHNEQAIELLDRALALQPQARAPLTEAAILLKLGQAHFLIGHGDTALDFTERGLAARKRLLGPDHPQVAAALQSLAKILITRSEHDRAAEILARAEKIWRAALGDESRQLAAVMNEQGLLNRYQGRYKRALELHTTSLEIRQRVLPVDHPEIATSLYNLGTSQIGLGNYAEAVPLITRCVEIYQRGLRPTHPRVAMAMNRLAQAQQGMGDYRAAEATYRRSAEMLIGEVGPEHADVSYPLSALADLLVDQRRYREALALHQRVLGIDRKVLGENHVDLAYSYTGIGESLLGLGRGAEAIAPLERALALRIGFDGVPDDLAKTEFALARTLALRGPDRDHPRARQLATSAKERYGKLPEKNAVELKAIDRWLARHGAARSP